MFFQCSEVLGRYSLLYIDLFVTSRMLRNTTDSMCACARSRIYACAYARALTRVRTYVYRFLM